jgi:hypothetical protein
MPSKQTTRVGGEQGRKVGSKSSSESVDVDGEGYNLSLSGSRAGRYESGVQKKAKLLKSQLLARLLGKLAISESENEILRMSKSKLQATKNGLEGEIERSRASFQTKIDLLKKERDDLRLKLRIIEDKILHRSSWNRMPSSLIGPKEPMGSVIDSTRKPFAPPKAKPQPQSNRTKLLGRPTPSAVGPGPTNILGGIKNNQKTFHLKPPTSTTFHHNKEDSVRQILEIKIPYQGMFFPSSDRQSSGSITERIAEPPGEFRDFRGKAIRYSGRRATYTIDIDKPAIVNSSDTSLDNQKNQKPTDKRLPPTPTDASGDPYLFYNQPSHFSRTTKFLTIVDPRISRKCSEPTFRDTSIN